MINFNKVTIKNITNDINNYHFNYEIYSIIDTIDHVNKRLMVKVYPVTKIIMFYVDDKNYKGLDKPIYYSDIIDAIDEFNHC
jgi:hypothetical protein